jgi:DNA-binding transcriptional LysR family regulator
MDLKQLESFVAVAEERHFTRAAQRLNVVQSGLSQTIRSLEDELGGPLFVRSTRRVDLTPAGKVLLQEAKRILLAVREARLAVTQVHGLARGQLRIGSIQSLAPFVDLPASLGRFRHKFPGIDIELVLDGAASLLDEVNEGRLDLAFTQPGDAGAAMAFQMLACEDMVLICEPNHPLANAPAPHLAELRDHTFIDLKADWGMRRLIDRSFASAGCTRKIAFELNDMTMLTGLVAQGLGIALVPESVARARAEDMRASPIAVIELADEEPPCWELVVGFKGRNGKPADSVAKAFLDLLISITGDPLITTNSNVIT